MTNSEAGKDTKVHPSAYGCITVPFLLLVLLTLGWGARNQWIAGELMRGGEVVSGRVIELRFVASNGAVVSNSTRGGSGRGESPVVTFTTREGHQRTAIGSVNRKPAPWQVGGTVDVVYDPKDPGRADLVTEVSSWRLWFGMWCVIALLLAGIASLPIVFRLRQSPGAQ
jgi:Protein of unknown function (DUF3592)